MRRDVLGQLLEAQRVGALLVRALRLSDGADRLINPGDDVSQFGEQASIAATSLVSHQAIIDGEAWFFCPYASPIEIVIVGAVHIAQALANLALASGYRVRIIDPRSNYATAERFPGVPLERLWADEALQNRPLSSDSALVVLAHDPKIDDPALYAGIGSPAFYVGALGSIRTQEKRRERLCALGASSAQVARIHGPVGMAIGARNPVEIAIAILAEIIQKWRTRRTGRFAGVLLAGGLSTRMAANKLTLPYKGKPLVRHAAEAALAAGLWPLIVVSGHKPNLIHEALAGLNVQFVYNANYSDGLSTSIKAGLSVVPGDKDGIVVLLGDMPHISPRLLGQLVERFAPAEDRSICVPTFEGERGNPVLWAKKYLPEMAQLTGDAGAKCLMSLYPDQVHEVAAADNSPLFDIDTPDVLTAACTSC